MVKNVEARVDNNIEKGVSNGPMFNMCGSNMTSGKVHVMNNDDNVQETFA